MDQSKVNPFIGNTEAPAGGAPVSDVSGSSTAASDSAPSVPVNPYAPAGAPYAPGSNTPAPDYATPYSGGTYASPSDNMSSDGPAVPNTGSSAYTSFSPASSQNQDIYMPSDSPEKPKLFTKKFIILASVGLVLIIGAVVAGVLVQNNKKTAGSNSSIDYKTAAKPYFDSYVKYLVYGDETASPKNIVSDIADGAIYAERMADDSNMDAKKKYFEDLEKKYQQFYEIYANIDGVSISPLKSYFYDFALLGPISDTELLSIYKTEGVDSASRYIANRLETKSGNADIVEYAKLSSNMYNAMLNLISEASSKGCLSETGILENCTSSLGQYPEYTQAESDFNARGFAIRNRLKHDALAVLMNVYDSYYGDSNE